MKQIYEIRSSTHTRRRGGKVFSPKATTCDRSEFTDEQWAAIEADDRLNVREIDKPATIKSSPKKGK